jgi:hypothetical protein
MTDQGVEGLELTGEISDLTVVELLKSIAIRDRGTGKISFTADGTTRTLFIREGRILAAQSSDEDERLGEILVKNGSITPKQYYAASERIRPGLRLGAILIETEALTPEALLDGVRLQATHIIARIFALRHGEYRALLEPFPAGDMASLNQTTEEILLHGILATEAFSRVMGAIGSLSAVYGPGPDQSRILPRVDLQEEEHHVMTLAKGTVSAGEICEMSYASHFTTLKILWALSALDLIEPVDAAAAAAAPKAELGPDAILERANQLFIAVHDDLARVDLGASNRAFAETLGALADAHPELLGAEFDSAGTLDPSTILYNLTRARCPDQRAACRRLVEEMLMTISFKARELAGPAGEKAVREAALRQRDALHMD